MFDKKIAIALILITLTILVLAKPSYTQDTKHKTHASEPITEDQIHLAAHGNAGVIGNVDTHDFDPNVYMVSWNFNNLPESEREKYYKEIPLLDGTLLREYWISAENKDIEIAPGVMFPAWTFNGQVPGPTIRATEGDTVKIHFTNNGDHPHSMHFHGFHPSEMDGATVDQQVKQGETFTYEFKAEPTGLHLYHCHTSPLYQHISKGLYGVYIVDPKEQRKPAKELIMVMNGFDTNFDEENEVYAVNTVAFYYIDNPIKVKLNETVRIYLVNILEFDQINSFHLHGNFFEEFKTGTLDKPNAFTDIITMGQGERSILELKFKYPGKFMFHAHKTEFAEKGWSGMFEVEK